MTRSLETVTHILETTNSPYRLVTTDPSSLYHGNIVMSYMEHDDHVYVSVHHALTTFKTLFNLYSVESFPLTFPNHDNKLLKITDLPQVILLSVDLEYFSEMDNLELDRLKIRMFHSQKF